jgi:flagellar biosynthetic protein FliP
VNRVVALLAVVLLVAVSSARPAAADDIQAPLRSVATSDVAEAAAQAASGGRPASSPPPSWPVPVSAGTLEALIPSMLMFGVVSLAPAVLLMTTCFVRMSVVLALVRQGLGAPQIPSNQVVAALAIFLSALVMWPVWTQAWRDGIEPCRRGEIATAEALDRGSLPIRRWMAAQIEQAGNRDTMLMFLARHPDGPKQPSTYDEVPVEALLPAFLVSELETAFTIGFRMLLPFLVLDLLVATLVVGTGLVMLPPSLVSLPLKLLVFVSADGWSLVVRTLLDSVQSLPT